uniref:EF-hand domain-containing protein n=1 Tax=Araucaria cunninghamii TaxID=56994 RepID=A0A0D6R4T0_ARACU
MAFSVIPLLKRMKGVLRRMKWQLKSASIARSTSTSSSSCAISTNGLVSAVPSLSELESAFKVFDANGDGLISWQELGEALRSVGHKDFHVDEGLLKLVVREADSNGDGFIDFAEFVELNTKNIEEGGCLRDLRNAFHIFDEDGNGQISAEELQRVFNSMGENFRIEECRRMIEGADCDGDGSVSFKEFLILMGAERDTRVH